jgi:hypothetical protein
VRDDPDLHLKHGPYVDPQPSWGEILQQGYLKSMDYFHATFEIKPKSRTWGQGGLQIDTVTTHTRVVVWTHAAKPILIMAFGEERTLLKAVEGDPAEDESKLDYLGLEVQWVVEDAEREKESAW